MIPITVFGDALDETGQLWGAEWGGVAFSAPVNATLRSGFGSLALALIVDDDPRPRVVPGGGLVIEGDDGTTVLEVAVSLSAPSGNTVTVDWTTGATAQPEPGVDFEAASGTVVFAPERPPRPSRSSSTVTSRTSRASTGVPSGAPSGSPTRPTPSSARVSSPPPASPSSSTTTSTSRETSPERDPLDLKLSC